MPHADAMCKGVYPKVLNLAVFSEMHRRQGMVDTFSEVQIALKVGEGDDISLVSLFQSWPIEVQMVFQVDQRPAQGTSCHRNIIEPGEEVPNAEMMVNCSVQICTSGSRKVHGTHCRLLSTAFATICETLWFLVCKLYLLSACVNQRAETLHS